MRELIWGKTLRSRLIRYNFFIIWVIAIFVSVCTYITASRKTLEVAKNSLQHHVESISYRYQLAYEEMINIVLNCTERKTFNLGEIGRGLTPGARKKGLDYAELIKDYCAISEYGDYIVKLSVFDDRGGMVQTGSSFGSTDDAKGILDGGWLDRELDKTMDSYELDLVDSPFFQHEGQVLPIARTLTGSRAVPGGWVVLCLSTDLFQDVLKDTSGGQEAVVVTSEGKRIASLYEPEDHREENDRVIRQLQQSGQDKGLLEMKIHGRNSLVAFEQYGRSGVMVGLIRDEKEDGGYHVHTSAIPIKEVMLHERVLPDEYINDRGNDVTDAFLKWCRPLIGPELRDFVDFKEEYEKMGVGK